MELNAAQKRKLIEYWKKGSSKDFDTARDIIEKTKRYSSGLFFLHLSIEKQLKALFVNKTSNQAPYSHNLLSLVAKCGLEVSEATEKVLIEINEYNLESRYPDEKFSLEKSATKKFALNQQKKAAEILKWISSNFSK